MSTPSPIPHPSYKNNKPYIQPVLDLFTELGAQDACLQLQEVAIVHLEKSAQAMNAHMNDYLKLLYMSNSIPQGSYSFADMRAQIYRSFITLTHSVFDKTLKGCNKAYQQKNPYVTWITTLKGGAALHPLEQLLHNCLPVEKVALTQPPEIRLLEYYRRIRIASVHVNATTAQDADLAFSNLTPADHQHFQKYPFLLGVPNAPGLLTFQDFRLYTRAVKYYIDVVNDVCA